MSQDIEQIRARLSVRPQPVTAKSSVFKQNLLAGVPGPIMAWTGYPLIFADVRLQAAYWRKRKSHG